MRAAAIAIVLVGVAAAAPARAQPATVEPTGVRAAPRDLVSLPLLSVSGLAGVGVQFEHQLDRRRFSVAAAIAVRGNAGGDYQSLAGSASLELRYWLRGRAIGSDLPRGAMVGWFAGARLDASRTTVRDRIEERDLATSHDFAETLTFGYRFAIRRRVEITPSCGFGVKTSVDTSGRLPAWTRSAAQLGITIGWFL